MSTPDPLTGVPVTGEAVTLDLRLARLPSRTVALAIDLCVQVPLLVVGLVLVGIAAGGLDGAATTALGLAVVVLVIVGYPTLVETLTQGRSLGKLAMGLRVVREDGGPSRFRHALVRALFLVPELWLTSGVLGLVACLFSAQGKRLGDTFAGTLVVNQRVARAAALPVAPPVPPALAPWAATLDLSRAPDAALAAAGSLLARWGSLEPGVRDRLAHELAGQVAATVSPPSPPGLPALAYLAAVVGERARRAYPAPAGGAAAAPAPPPHPWTAPAPAAAAPPLPPAAAPPPFPPPS